MREHANSKFPDFRLRNPFYDGLNEIAFGVRLLITTGIP